MKQFCIDGPNQFKKLTRLDNVRVTNKDVKEKVILKVTKADPAFFVFEYKEVGPVHGAVGQFIESVRSNDGYTVTVTRTALDDPNFDWVAYNAGQLEQKIIGIKVEAQRRIYAIVPEYKQTNMAGRAAELAMIANSRALSADEQAEWEAGQVLWDQIKAIRARSNELEAAPPDDYTDDKHWIL